MKKYFKKVLLGVTLGIAFSTSFFVQDAFAVVASLSTYEEFVYEGQSFEVDLILDTENKKINALEGEVSFDSDVLEFVRVNNANSFVSFWIDSPDISSEGVLTFSGMTPGGIDKGDAKVFSVVFKAKEQGGANIRLNNFLVLENSIEASSLPTSYENISLIIKEAEEGAVFNDVVPEDTVPPEDFEVVLARDPNIFDGLWFVAFSTQDKGSGIWRYEVCESGEFSCDVAESPYLLKRQARNGKIVVVAYDNAGNKTEAIVYESGFVLKIVVTTLIVFAIIVATLFYAKRRKLWWFKN